MQRAAGKQLFSDVSVWGSFGPKGGISDLLPLWSLSGWAWDVDFDRTAQPTPTTDYLEHGLKGLCAQHQENMR